MKTNAEKPDGGGIRIRPVTPEDTPRLKAIMLETHEFSKDDFSTCVECLEAYFNREPSYAFVCAEDSRGIVGFICYDKAPIAKDVYELYWIVVAPGARRSGIAKMLDDYFVETTMQLGARMLFAETESIPKYATARGFYERCGYKEMARIKDFYDSGNDKVIYGKTPK